MRAITKVVAATHLWGMVVFVEFAGGRKSVVDFAKLFRGPAFEQILEDGTFDQFVVDPDEDTLVWPNGADIDPETIWSASEMTSEDPSGDNPSPSQSTSLDWTRLSDRLKNVDGVGPIITNGVILLGLQGDQDHLQPPAEYLLSLYKSQLDFGGTPASVDHLKMPENVNEFLGMSGRTPR